ncbi:adenine methyltransferase [Enterococcus sp. AZ112]|uniref:adenine methyltransferase n=1 Tax=Enterococcus sp. AZ112 TaxID=2774812 RepID=UPI003F686896
MKKYCIFSTHHVKFFLKKLDRGETNAILKHSTAQHSTAQHSTAQHSTAQHSTAQHSTAR